MSINVTHKKLFNHTNKTASIPSREEISEKHKWDLGDIYKSNDEWENDFAWVEKQIEGYKNFEGKLHESIDILEKCFSYNDAVGIKIERLYLYSMLSKDSDMRVSTFQAMDDRIKTLYSKVNAASSFINITQVPFILFINFLTGRNRSSSAIMIE